MDRKDQQLAHGLGLFSLGLGAAQVAVPGHVARWIGVEDGTRTRWIMRGLGARELMVGISILFLRKPAPWLWARVGGDTMDMALLGTAFWLGPRDRQRLMGATAAVAGITALDAFSGKRLSQAREGATTYMAPDGTTDMGFPPVPATGDQREEREEMGDARRSRAAGAAGGSTAGPKEAAEHGDPTAVKHTVTIARPVEEVYAFWHTFENLPRFMSHVESVQAHGNGRTHWRAKVGGKTVEWDAETVEDRPNTLISWRSVAGSPVEHAGSVSFQHAPGGRGTEVRVSMRYVPPAGPLGVVGAMATKLFGHAPDQEVLDDLRAFKSVMEAGEVVQSEATVHGHPHPGSPPGDDEMAGFPPAVQRAARTARGSAFGMGVASGMGGSDRGDEEPRPLHAPREAQESGERAA